MTALLDKKKELYGPGRNARFEQIKDTLTRSSVLQDGEYNYTNNKLKRHVWSTSHSTDFPGSTLDYSCMPGTKSQLVHHFDMGNMSGKHLDKVIYRHSTTKEDFDGKTVAKPEIQNESPLINWPDMAPRYHRDRRVGPSEYASSFITELRMRSAPNYPRVDTSKLKLPLDPAKFWRQRNTNFSLGCDNEGQLSEQQRVYGRGDPAFQARPGEKDAARTANNKMKEMDKVSHVFRSGDYDNIVGKFLTTCNGDYGPRTVPPGEAAIRRKILLKPITEDGVEDEEEKKDDDEEEDYNYGTVNQLQKYARDVTVPEVFKDAADGKTYQTSAHFHLGHDEEKGHSIYAKDYTLSSMLGRIPPHFHSTPDAGKLLQFDPNQSKFGVSSSSIDFQGTSALPYRNSEGKTAMDINLGRRDTDNVTLSFDLGRHLLDRQKSLNHTDYIRPPSWYKPMALVRRPTVHFDYLQTDDALPYPAPLKNTSEAKHNFAGLMMHGKTAKSRKSSHKKEAKHRTEDNRNTHFVVGYTPFDFLSETRVNFRGDAKADQDVPVAGKTEQMAPTKFQHLSHSANTVDLVAADPHVTNTRESLPARIMYQPAPPERTNTTSVMKKDYTPLYKRSLTEAQLKTLDKYDVVTTKDVANSHFFHTDNSGRNNFVSTAMDDFIKPETMTGRKYLAAR